MSRSDHEFSGAHRYTDEDLPCPVLLVGEDNPLSADPRHALYPYPPGCAGYRLAEDILDVGTAHQLATWRTNLCNPRWNSKQRGAEGRAAGKIVPLLADPTVAPAGTVRRARALVLR